MLGFRDQQTIDELASSHLLNQDNFYSTFTSDLLRAKRQVIIESPFISLKRFNYLLPVFRKLVERNVQIIINTKPPEEQDPDYRRQAEGCIAVLLELGIDVLITGGHHRKLAIIDQRVLYEGSLNILSQNDSCEIMRRVHSAQLSAQMIDFIGIGKFIE